MAGHTQHDQQQRRYGNVDKAYDDLGLKDVKPYPDTVADYKKGLTCCWCRSTFFNDDAVKHIESILLSRN